MRGTIKMECQLGVGSTFAFKLKLPITEIEVDSHSGGNNEADNLASMESGKLSGKRVLVAEDNKINQLIVVKMLTSFGMQRTLAENAREAVHAAHEQDFDIILMDIQMPEMNGYEATSEIRKLPNYTDVQIVAVTANAMSDDKQTSLDCGMNSHITKPINVNKLLAELSSFF